MAALMSFCHIENDDNDNDRLAIAEMLDEMVAIVEADEPTANVNRHTECLMCHQRSKYTCPKCTARTCSVDCVRRHKSDAGCDGIRDKTAYVAVNDFTHLHLLSDYRLLEEMTRSVSNAKRNRRGGYIDSTRPMQYSRPRLPYMLYRLVVECRNRGTTLEIMPQTFKRRRENTTRFNPSEGKFYWRIVWELPQANATYTDDLVSEDCLLETAVEKYLCPDSGVASNSAVDHRLEFYWSAGYNGVVPLMKVEHIKSSVPRYVELDFAETIEWNLGGKKIIEFPTILLVLRNHLDYYSVLEESETGNVKHFGKRQKEQQHRKRAHDELSEGECSTTATSSSDGDNDC